MADFNAYINNKVGRNDRQYHDTIYDKSAINYATWSVM